MLKALLVAGACILAAPATALAEWHITPMVGLTFAGKTTIFDPDEGTGKRHPSLSGSVAALGSGIIGAEGIFEFTPRFFQSGDDSVLFTPGQRNTLVESSHALSLMGNVVVTAPKKWTEYFLRPFVSGGFGLLRVSKREALDIFPTTLNLPGYNIGGGAVGFLTRNTGVRFDLRYYSTIRGTDRGPAFGEVRVRYMTLSIGLVIRPGRTR